MRSRGCPRRNTTGNSERGGGEDAGVVAGVDEQLARDEFDSVESGDECLESTTMAMSPDLDSRLVQGLSNDDEVLLAGDREGIVEGGDCDGE